MKVKDACLEAMAQAPEGWPTDPLPEIAMVGRSNVGKSSFINALCKRKKLAYTSSSPGKTRTINFYNINGVFRLVDLPGYGYARVSKKDRASWAKFINDYLADRDNLVDVFLLADIRHEPNLMDREMYDWILDGQFSGTVIGTKADKLSKNKRDQARSLLIRTLDIPDRSLFIPFSSIEGSGVREAWSRIDRILDRSILPNPQ